MLSQLSGSFMFILASGLLLTTGVLSLNDDASRRVAASSSRPNVLLLVADQMRADHFTAELTPNLWRLSQRGVRFERAYTSVPICPAARAALLTGKAPWQHGLRGYGEIAQWYNRELPVYFGRHGYTTASIGKTHFGWVDGKMPNHGFQYMRSYEGLVAEDDYTRWFDEQYPGEDPSKSGDISCRKKGPKGTEHEDWCWNSWRGTTFEYPERIHPTTWTADEAVQYLSTVEDGPWFAQVSFHRPHSPYDPPERLFNSTPPPQSPPAMAKDGWDAKYRNCDLKGQGDSWCGEVDDWELKRTRQAYRAAVAHVDEEMGRVLQAVDLSKTWVVFLSDHGDLQMDHYLWRKSVPYEGATKIPLVMAWPEGSRPASVAGPRYELAELRDVFPTIVQAVGLIEDSEDVRAVADLDGLDLLCPVTALPLGDDCPKREYLDLEHSTGGPIPREYHWNALTDGVQKYIFFADGEEQLFDLEHDPREERNLARSEEYAGKLADWRRRLAEHFLREGRGSSWVSEAGELVRNRKPMILSPLYPETAAGKQVSLRRKLHSKRRI